MRVATAADVPALAALRASWGATLGGAVDDAGTDDLAARLRRWWERQPGARTAWLAVGASMTAASEATATS